MCCWETNRSQRKDKFTTAAGQARLEGLCPPVPGRALAPRQAGTDTDTQTHRHTDTQTHTHSAQCNVARDCVSASADMCALKFVKESAPTGGFPSPTFLCLSPTYDEMGNSIPASASLASAQESCEHDVDSGPSAESPFALDGLFRPAAEFSP